MTSLLRCEERNGLMRDAYGVGLELLWRKREGQSENGYLLIIILILISNYSTVAKHFCM